MKPTVMEVFLPWLCLFNMVVARNNQLKPTVVEDFIPYRCSLKQVTARNTQLPLASATVLTAAAFWGFSPAPFGD